jgi:hypothetical protein
MKSQFLSELNVELCPGCDGIWSLRGALGYYSELLGRELWVPHSFPVIQFYTDFASVPRVPIVYEAYGDRAHREAVIHDYLFCKNSDPVVSFMMANRVFLEAMIAREKPLYVAYPMFWGVVIGGYPSYHKRNVEDDLTAKQIKQHKADTVKENIDAA